ncbi:MAG: GatB/YqeY domain-containing protein [Bullifex sp.]|nr:GatB/YqeY domain-containing protein [Bullifex sp.]
MSDLAVRVQSDLVAAMKNKDELTLSVLRMLKSSIQLMQVEKGKDKELALYYAEEAEKIYTADENIREILKNLRK